MNYAKRDFDDDVITLLKEVGVNEHLIHFAKTNIERNDVAHWFDHVGAVVKQGLFLSRLVTVESSKAIADKCNRIVATAALLHDTACWMDRDRHHEIAAEWIMDTLDNQESLDFYGLIPDEVPIIAKAILEHRASWQLKRSCLESEIVAAADRGKLEYEECLRRSYLYGRFKKGLDPDQALTHACEHIAEKFGVRGYAYENLPKLCLMAQDDINLLRNQAMDKKLGRSIIIKHRDAWEKFYQEVKHASE